MGSSEEVKFLSGGLLHYPLAATAVSRFKGMVYSQLEKGLARRWSSDGKPGRNDDVGDETYIELWRHVKLKTGDLATISIGLGWDTEGGYLYVYCQDGPEWAKHPNAPHF